MESKNAGTLANSSTALRSVTAIPMRTRLTSAVTVGLLITACLAFIYVVRFDGRISGFFRIGTILPHSAFLDEADLLVHAGELGYDGQQFLAIALDPALRHPATAIALDNPKYRYRRIVYPVLGWGLSAGRPAVIPYALVLINVACVVLIGYALTALLRTSGPRGTVPFLTLVVPGVWIVLFFSTADLMASTFFLYGVLSYERQKSGALASAFALALLTKETMLVPWLAFLACSLFDHRKRDALWLGAGALPALVWNAYVLSLPFPASTSGLVENFSIPFKGIVEKVTSVLTGPLSRANLYEGLSFLLLLMVFTHILCSRRGWAEARLKTLSIAAYFGILLFADMHILGYYLDYMRVFIDVFWILILSEHIRPLSHRTVLLAWTAFASLGFLVAFGLGRV